MNHTVSSTVSNPRQTRTRRRRLLLAALAFAAIDLGVKALAENRLTDTSVDLGVLQLRLAHNNGVAFSLGDTLPSGVVVAVTAAITLAMALYGWQHVPGAHPRQLLAGGAIVGGAAANVVDRAGDGVVTDYLHTGWWPTFNLADTFLVIGCFTLAFGHVLAERVGAPPVTDERSSDPAHRPRREAAVADQRTDRPHSPAGEPGGPLARRSRKSSK